MKVHCLTCKREVEGVRVEKCADRRRLVVIATCHGKTGEITFPDDYDLTCMVGEINFFPPKNDDAKVIRETVVPVSVSA